MGQCGSAQRVRVPEAVVEARCASSAQLCAQEAQAAEFLRHGELEALEEIVDLWSNERIASEDAKARIMREVLRSYDHLHLAMQSSVEAATHAGLHGAAAGAETGRVLANAFSSMAGEIARGSSLSRSVSAQRVGQVATGALGIVGMLAGGVVGGVTTAVAGGTRAGFQPRAVFVFVDRVMLRSTKEEIWERAARELDVDGLRPPAHELEAYFRAKMRGVWNDMHSRDGTWLKLFKLCFCLEILRYFPSPPSRINLPRESMFEEVVRFDQDFLRQRVQEVINLLGVPPLSELGMTTSEICERCPIESLEKRIDEECVICLEVFEASTVVRRLPCAHILHKECCEAWLSKAPTCPICRHDVRLRCEQSASQV
eukprot:TRINITY_DN20036_c0_g1_i1.p1 TRINITY_DN20036_c0_g1~~TRINITY_DN20036_c0_g1_i1.p1  ORF type:complete len:371 (+),score=36.85 TRINITY_DN20036_c0_g1_i1:55-1167(+)